MTVNLKGSSPIKMETGLTGSLIYINYNLGTLASHLHNNRTHAKGDGGASSPAFPLWAWQLAC